MKRLTEQTLYEILEIPQDASPAAIEAAVERARALYGPGSLATYTLMSPEEASALVARIDEAKRTLLDPEARARYDASLAPREGEVRAAVNGSLGGNGVNGVNGIHGAAGAAPPFNPVPVIPALQPPPQPPAPPEPAAARPPEPLPIEREVERKSAREEPAPAPAARAPIRLYREIPQPGAAAPPVAAAPVPGSTTTPVPLTAPVPAPTPAPAPAQVEPPMPEGGAWTGEALRRAREARGITLPQIAERTKVTRHHVENIEAERYSALPAPVYLRGILLSIARELRLDGQKVARAYLERIAVAGSPDKPK